MATMFKSPKRNSTDEVSALQQSCTYLTLCFLSTALMEQKIMVAGLQDQIECCVSLQTTQLLYIVSLHNSCYICHNIVSLCRQHSPIGPPEGEGRCCIPSGSLQWNGGGFSQQQRADPLLVRGGEGVRGRLSVSQQHPCPLH